MNLISSGMRTKINKKRGRPSDCSEEARAKGAKQGKNSWGFGGWCWKASQQGPEKLAFLTFIIVKNAIYLQEMLEIPDR